VKRSKLLLLALFLAAGACTPAVDLAPEATSAPTPLRVTPTIMSPTNDPTPDLSQLPQVAQSIADLAQRLNVPPGDIEVVLVESVVWPDGSFGCPQPGMVYAQVLQEGLRVVLRHGGLEYAYHSGGNQAPFLCEQPVAIEKATPIDGDDLLTEPPPDT
jgi:hypothetical protein